MPTVNVESFIISADEKRPGWVFITHNSQNKPRDEHVSIPLNQAEDVAKAIVEAARDARGVARKLREKLAILPRESVTLTSHEAQFLYDILGDAIG